MALCGNCGTSVGKAEKCWKCGSTKIEKIDRTFLGIGNIPDRRTVDGDWDAAAAELMKTPSKESLKEVKREARRNRWGRSKKPSYRSGHSNWGSWQTKFFAIILLLSFAVIFFHQYF